MIGDDITDEMIEAAARAICVDDGENPDEGGFLDPLWKYNVDPAYAALLAAAAVIKTQRLEVTDELVELASRASWDVLHKEQIIKWGVDLEAYDNQLSSLKDRIREAMRAALEAVFQNLEDGNG